MLTLIELQAVLCPRNPFTELLIDAIKFLQNHANCTVERKDASLVETVQHLIENKLYPVVDKKLKLVLATSTSGHDVLRQQLFRYHYHADDPDLNLPYVDSFESRDRYISEQYGYFISSMRPNVIVVGEGYRADRFDRDLFMIYEINRF